ncbi:hypothetical protein PIB30_010391 [Stylosanthes scabra]|uniref:F-box domain-containing protein n=1 Tax=Stylosanthes scabra TaxID=79078 RepID=A0ABU6X3T5_9FABA|nr:hypothetical protein [Stylosanthes scabra]
MRRRHPDEGIEKKGKAIVTRRTPSPPLPPNLPEEIVEEILLTHPASSLVQLRSVCRSWRTLISSSRFTNEHLRRSIFLDPTLTQPRIAYYSLYKYPTIGVFSVQSLLDNKHKPTNVASFKAPRHFWIYGSCNGLLCLAHETDTGVMNCILWNPCTGSTSESAPQITGGFGFYGFGYDHISDRYKLIGYLQESRSNKSTIIYTFAPNSSWRTIPAEDDVDFTPLGHPPDECPIYDCNNMEGVFVSNTLNWIVDRYRGYDVVLSFDLGTETYCYLSLPERDPEEEDDPCLSVASVLRDCLAVCFEHKRTHWAVWLMKEYGVTQSWTRLALIPHPVGYNPNVSHYLRPKYLFENDVLLAISPSSKIVLYNLNDDNKDGPLVPMIDGSGDGMESRSVNALSKGFIVYHESLVSPSHYGIASKRPLIKPNKPTTTVS